MRIAALLAVFLMLPSCSKEAQAVEPGSFRLVFWSRDADKKIVPIRDRATLTSGTTVGMMVEGTGTCDIYIIYRDAGGNVHVLFPVEGGSASEKRSRQLFEDPLDETTGREKFFVIASKKPVESLAGVIEAVRAGRAEGNDLMAEVEELRGAYEIATAPPAKPVPIGGAMRGEVPEAAALQYEVGERPLFLTFTIEHR